MNPLIGGGVFPAGLGSFPLISPGAAGLDSQEAPLRRRSFLTMTAFENALSFDYRLVLKHNMRIERRARWGREMLDVYRSGRSGGMLKIQHKLEWLRLHGGDHPVTRARGDALRALVR